ncbi:MAG: aminotransferase class V-fold PLP-dependent enzyme [Candidatus Latescibacterota bacterium]|jgi:L-seryl-tRNA(Ser) seleniumtransferase
MDKSIYAEIGLRPVINAMGSMTFLGGSLMAPEVLEAMDRAARHFVQVDELIAWGGREVARLTGAPAGHITTGSAGGLLLATAACLTGLDRKRMQQLPDTTGLRNEVVVQRLHRISFDQAVRTAGARLVEAGDAAGCTAAQLEATIGERTAALLYVDLHPQAVVPLAEAAAIAHRHGLPLILDAAAELPPAGNLNAFLRQGADLVIFSGGKDIAGPNDSGILCGRADLVQAAAFQSFPNSGIGRPLKVGKEQIVGLVWALRRWAALDHGARVQQWQAQSERICQALAGLRGVQAEVALGTKGPRPVIVPKARVTVDAALMDVGAVAETLIAGEPSIAISIEPRIRALWLSPQHLEPGQEEIVAARVRQVLAQASPA